MTKYSLAVILQEKDDFCFIETDKSVWALLEPESDIVLGLLAVRNWLPRHATRANMRNLLIYLYLLARCTCGRLKSALLEVRECHCIGL